MGPQKFPWYTGYPEFTPIYFIVADLTRGSYKVVIRLIGKWKEGYAIDKHTISSTYLGEDNYGHPIFDTKRSEIGELIYLLKYQKNINIVNDIMKFVEPVLDKWKIGEKIDIIIPIPPTDSSRNFQPVFLIAKAISDYLNIPMSTQVLEKNKHEQIKNVSYDKKLKAIKDSIIKEKKFKKKVNILLIDDLFDSGATLNEAVDVLKTDVNISDVYVLVMTQTRGR